ncbi:MAG: LysM peptidoglycan-binding domain-containing protein [Gemmatimonadota bacterium]|nr:LysM peptidoglycan-binding domain-containing protein [Gemmatimonadota bacterium]
MSGRVARRMPVGVTRHGYRVWLLGSAALLLPAVLSAQDPTPPKDTTAAQVQDTTPVALQGGGAGERTHTVKRGNTLWDIARMYLNDPFQWPEIYRYNRDVVEDPHWIFPGEVLRIPGAGDEAVVEIADTTSAPVDTTGRPTDPVRTEGPTVFTQQGNPPAPPPRVEEGPEPAAEEDTIPVVRPGQVAAAPWVDRVGGPRDPGQVYRSRDLSGMARGADRGPFQLFEEVLFDPPGGATVRLGDRYLAYDQGPIIEGLGQLMVPTGVLEVVRLPERIRGPGRDVAGVARVVRLFRDLREPNRLIPFDPTLAIASGRPRRMLPEGAPVSRVRWVVNEPVLPSVQAYVVIDASSRAAVRVGDEFAIFEPRRRGAEGEPTLPETPIGTAQAVRVTPYATTAIVIKHQQPAIRPGARARVSAKTP